MYRISISVFALISVELERYALYGSEAVCEKFGEENSVKIFHIFFFFSGRFLAEIYDQIIFGMSINFEFTHRPQMI